MLFYPQVPHFGLQIEQIPGCSSVVTPSGHSPMKHVEFSRLSLYPGLHDVHWSTVLWHVWQLLMHLSHCQLEALLMK